MLERCVQLFLHCPYQPARAVLRLLGHMADFMPCGCLHMRPLQFCLLSQWRPHVDSLEDCVQVHPEILEDLRWWSQRANTYSGIPLEIPRPSATLMTDASLEGWGASLIMGEVRLQAEGRWPSLFQGRSINSLELESVLLVLEKWARTSQAKCCWCFPTTPLQCLTSGSKGGLNRQH